jgi:transmembrane serine protease 9
LKDLYFFSSGGYAMKCPVLLSFLLFPLVLLLIAFLWSGTTGSQLRVTRAQSASLALSKHALTSVVAGEPFIYTLTVQNTGTATATNLVITDTLPLSVTFVSASHSAVLTDTTVQWEIASLAAGATQQVTVAVKTPAFTSPFLQTARRSAPDERIVGGEQASDGAWPWQAALVWSDRNAYDGAFCGGSLLHAEWVLTSAHCVHYYNDEPVPPSEIHVVLGRNRLSTNEGERLAVQQIIAHPRYQPATLEHDIALLKLATPSQQTPIRPATPQDTALFAPDVLSTVTGWGDISERAEGDYPDALYEVDVPIVANALCEAAYDLTLGEDDWIGASMLCAGYAEGGKDACFGDSGGPLVVPDGTGRFVQAGIVSWGGSLCAQPEQYGVYTRVADYTDWIAYQIAAYTVVNEHYRVHADDGISASGNKPVTTLVEPPPVTATTYSPLEIAKTGPATVYSKQTVSYTITVKNKGTQSVADVMIVDHLPASTTFLAASHGGSYQEPRVTWQIDTLKPGAQTAVSLTLQAPANEYGLVETPTSASTPQQRIVGGTEATAGAWPWQVALWDRYTNQQFCGGTLLNARWVLTAAHCASAVPASDMEVVGGAHNLTINEPDQQRVAVARAIIHPAFNALTLDEDIALLKLSKPLSLTSRVQPVALVDSDDLARPGTLATVTGWGDLFEGSNEGSETLQQVSLPIVANEQCEEAFDWYFGSDTWVTDNMLCAGYEEGGKDTCSGDSGGPLVVPDSQHGYRQAGIVSWGIGCAQPYVYGVYTRVSHYISWIEQHMAPVIVNGYYYAVSADTPQTLGNIAVKTTVLNNHAPTVIKLDHTEVEEQAPIGTVIGTLSTVDEDGGEQQHTYTLLDGKEDVFIKGDKLFTNAVFDYETRATFTIQIRSNDGHGGIVDATFSIQVQDVNEAPHALADTYTTNEDERLEIAAEAGLLINDADPDGDDSLTVSLHSEPVHGSLTLQQDGAFQYTPHADYAGRDRFTYVASDGDLTSAETMVHIEIAPVNDPPSLAVNQGMTLVQGKTVILSSTHLRATDQDDVYAKLRYLLVWTPGHGKLQKDGVELRSSFTQADIDQQRISYEHNGDLSRRDSFGFLLQDPSGATTSTATFRLTIQRKPFNAIQLQRADEVVPTGGTTTLTATVQDNGEPLMVEKEVTFTMTRSGNIALDPVVSLTHQGKVSTTLHGGTMPGQARIQAFTEDVGSVITMVTVYEPVKGMVGKPVVAYVSPDSPLRATTLPLPTGAGSKLVTGSLTFTSSAQAHGQALGTILATTVATPAGELQLADMRTVEPLGGVALSLYDSAGSYIRAGQELTEPCLIRMTFDNTNFETTDTSPAAQARFVVVARAAETDHWHAEPLPLTRLIRDMSGRVTVWFAAPQSGEYGVFAALPDTLAEEQAKYVYLPIVFTAAGG